MRKSLLNSMLIAGMLAVGMNVQAKVDVTDQYVLNADLFIDPLEEGNGWELLNGWRQDWKVAEDEEHVNVVEFYAGWGSLEKTEYAMKQTLSLPAGSYRLAVNAFYRHGGDGNGKNNDYAYIFAGEKRQNVYALANMNEIHAYTGSSDLWQASNAFYQGKYSNEFDFTMETAGEIEIGFEGTFDLYRSWVILGPVKLYQYTLEDYISDYSEKVPDAEALLSEKMSAAALAALNDAIKDVSSFSTIAEVTAAIQALNDAIVAATNSITLYEQIATTIEQIKTVDPGLDFTSMDNAYDNGTLESVDELWPMFQQLEIAQLGTASGTDYTMAIINPSFEFGNTFGWTYDPSGDHGAKQVSNDTYYVENADGEWLFNIWSSGNPISQTIEGLPNGLYLMTALIATDGGHQVRLFANEQETIVDASPEATEEELAEGIVGGKKKGVVGKVLVNVSGGSLTIGAEGVSRYWYKVDDFHLTYKPDASEVVGDKIDEANEVLSKKMSATAKANLEDAINNVSSDAMQAIENINEALTAAKASVAVYEQINNAIQKIQELDPEVDVFDMQDAYDEGDYETLEDVYPLYHTAKIALLPKTDNTDYTGAIINPSFEFGDAFGWTYEPSNDSGVKSNDTMPYTIDIAHGDYVFNIWRSGNPITQTIVGLPNGEYELSAVIASTSNEEGTYLVKLFANDVEELVEAAPEGENFGNVGTLTVTVTNGTLTIGAMGGGEWEDEQGNIWPTWYKVDDFHLTLVKVSGGIVGDVNGDGRVNSADVQKVYSLMAQSATGATNPEADINNDGQVNSADIQKIYGIMATSPAK